MQEENFEIIDSLVRNYRYMSDEDKKKVIEIIKAYISNIDTDDIVLIGG